MSDRTRFSSLHVEERAAALMDPGTLARLDSEVAADAPVWVGGGQIDGRPVLLALTDGHVSGGTVGVREARALAQLTAAASREHAAVVVCWDTGGVRVQGGPLALASASAVGVALARIALTGPPLISVVSGPRGCFGAPAVMAGLSHHLILTENARWGLTGPKLLRAGSKPADEHLGLAATSAAHRFKADQVDAVVPDSVTAIRAELSRFLARPRRLTSSRRALDLAVARIMRLTRQMQSAHRNEPRRAVPATPGRRQRDLLRFSFRGHWRPTSPIVRRGLVHAAWGDLDGRPALGIIVGYQGARSSGVGIEDASAVSEMIRFAVRTSSAEPAPILTFLFCQGHAIDIEQERFGLQRALAECLRSFVVARLQGHPLMCVLGGGAYGAAYLSFAAPCHRVLAMRGTTVAPMAPNLLSAFRSLRGMREHTASADDLAELIPEIRMVDSVIRLPRVLREELDTLLQTVRPADGAKSVRRRRRARSA
jgi:malonate decarboxylase beta subunit